MAFKGKVAHQIYNNRCEISHKISSFNTIFCAKRRILRNSKRYADEILTNNGNFSICMDMK
jgi:hypothetical protein